MGIPQNRWFLVEKRSENPTKLDDHWGYPFPKTPIFRDKAQSHGFTEAY